MVYTEMESNNGIVYNSTDHEQNYRNRAQSEINHGSSKSKVARNGYSLSYAKMHTKEARATSMSRLTGYGLSILGTMVTIILGATMRGDWIIILVHFLKQSEDPNVNLTSSAPVQHPAPDDVFGRLHPQLANVHICVCLSVIISIVSFYCMAGFLQYYYYIKQKEQPELWKCQPTRWLSEENERHEILMGSINMTLGGTISGVIACYILNGGYTTLYFSVTEYGWWYLPVSWVIVFVVFDFLATLAHRIFHIPLLYRHIHRHHHRYHTPTAFSGTAMHPVEFITYQSIMASPAFIMPLYSGIFIVNLLYGYYYGMLAHSGIMFDALWPWQPSSKFHDDHHRYFHVHYGFNTKLWDWLHDSLRKEDRVYGEDIFNPKTTKKIE